MFCLMYKINNIFITLFIALASSIISSSTLYSGIAGAVAISFLLTVVAIMITIRRYRKSKRVNLNQHNIYDTPDSYDVRPLLPPRPRKLQRTDQLLHSVDTKQLRDHPIEDAQNCAHIEKNWEEELKETNCDHTQPTDDNNCCHKLLVNDSSEGNASPSTPVQINGTVLDHACTERTEESCDPSSSNSSNFPAFSVLSSGQTCVYEQIQGYEKIQHYEQIQRYEKIRHCDINIEVENVTSPAPTRALTKQIAGSSEDTQSQHHLLVADCCHEHKGLDLETSLIAQCHTNQETENITESNLDSALDSASVQIESLIPVNISENDDLQSNSTGTCFEGSNSNSGGYERICRYERIQYCDLNFAQMLSPAITEDVANTTSSE